jgi:hypothetical protein
MVIIPIFLIKKRKERFQIIKALETNGGEWKMSFEVPCPSFFDPREKQKKIINPNDGKRYKWDKIERTDKHQAFMEINYFLILNPEQKPWYIKKTFSIFPKIFINSSSSNILTPLVNFPTGLNFFNK